MVSAFMPSVVVEIAFTSTYATPAASRVWTDVSSYVELAEGIGIDIGRQDEMSVADANSLTLTLDNTDGRFTALRSASPYYPNVKIGRPIRVTATPPGGTASTRFVGFIDEWPVEWDGSDAYAMAKIKASSRLSRLGLTAQLRSTIEQTILADEPDAYYTLGEPSGAASAADSSGNGMSSLRVTGVGAAVVFGSATGPATDGMTAATFAGGKYLGGVRGASGSHRWFECFFLRDGSPAAAECILTTVGRATVSLVMNTSGQIEVRNDNTVRMTSASSYADNSTHHVALVSRLAPSNGAWLYVDGVEVATFSALGIGVSTDQSEFRVGGSDGYVAGLTGVIAHAAIEFATATDLSAARVAAHADAGLTGFAGERTDERLLRSLGWMGVASTEVDVETGVETMDYQQTSGQGAIDALHECEATEGGVLFDGPDGNVKFHNRSHRYLSTAAATLDMTSQHVGADYAPRLDRSALVNDVTVSNPTTNESARAVDGTSSAEYGIATTSASSVAESYAPLQEKAGWLLALYAEPRMRCPSLTVDVLAHQGLTPSAQTLLGVTVGDLLAVTNAPAQSDTTSPTYFVEGYSESIGPESYSITYNLSPTYPVLDTFVLDDATRGVLDTSILAY